MARRISRRRSTRRSNRIGRSACESLETRQLLASAAFNAATHTLTVTGSNQADNFLVAVYSDGVQLSNAGSNDVADFQFDTYPIQHVKVLALDGNDTVDFYGPDKTSPIDVNFDLGGGADTFTGKGFGVTVNGGAGNDTITGTNFRDNLSGGDGDDSIDGSAGIDTINGGGGNDKAADDGLDSLTSIETKVSTRGSVQVLSNGTALILGTDGADDIRIEGFSQADVTLNGRVYKIDDDEDVFPDFTRVEIRGGGGDDFIGTFEPRFSSLNSPPVVFDGGNGNDTFVIDDSYASVIGGLGDDIVYLRNSANLDGFSDVGGNDTINGIEWRPSGGPGLLDLRLYPSVENGINEGAVIGNDLDNLIIAESSGQNDNVSGGKGNDIIQSNMSGTIDGGDGNDRLIGDTFGDTPQTLNGGAGTDTVSGGSMSTYISAEVHATLPPTPITQSSSGNITVTGTDGPDVIAIYAALDSFAGDTHGFAVVNGVPYEYFASARNIGITVRGMKGNDRIELKASGAGARGIFNGDDGNDTLIGGSYNDSLLGGGNDDTLDGRGGGDLMQGGTGSDTVDYSSRTANLTVGIGTAADDGEAGEKDNVYLDVEKVIGGSGNDKITGSSGNNVLYGGKGNDTLLGGGGNDALFGQDGNDSLEGNDGADYLDGGAGNDTLNGGSGVDSMFGFDGNDTFFARDGNKETLHGGLGTDKAQKDASDVLDSVEQTIA